MTDRRSTGRFSFHILVLVPSLLPKVASKTRLLDAATHATEPRSAKYETPQLDMNCIRDDKEKQMLSARNKCTGRPSFSSAHSSRALSPNLSLSYWGVSSRGLRGCEFRAGRAKPVLAGAGVVSVFASLQLYRELYQFVRRRRSSCTCRSSSIATSGRGRARLIVSSSSCHGYVFPASHRG